MAEQGLLLFVLLYVLSPNGDALQVTAEENMDDCIKAGELEIEGTTDSYICRKVTTNMRTITIWGTSVTRT